MVRQGQDLYTWIIPSTKALMEAVQMRRKGHKDMIDDMLYVDFLVYPRKSTAGVQLFTRMSCN